MEYVFVLSTGEDKVAIAPAKRHDQARANIALNTTVQLSGSGYLGISSSVYINLLSGYLIYWAVGIMVASPSSNAKAARSRTGTPNPPAGHAGDSSRRPYGTRGAQKATARPLTPIQTENLEGGGSDEDEEQDGTQQAASSKDAASDAEDDRGNLRRSSRRIASKAAAREITAQIAPSPPQAPKKLPKGGGRAAATPSGDTASSPGGTPAPLQDTASLNKLSDVVSKVAKARKGPYNRAAPSAPSTRELLTGIEATGSADVVEVLVTDPNDMLAGYKQLEDWIYGGLDMYRVG